MEHGPKQDHKLTKKEIGCVLTGGALLVALFTLNENFKGEKNIPNVDALMIYGGASYMLFMLLFVSYGPFTKEK